MLIEEWNDKVKNQNLWSYPKSFIDYHGIPEYSFTPLDTFYLGNNDEMELDNEEIIEGDLVYPIPDDPNDPNQWSAFEYVMAIKYRTWMFYIRRTSKKFRQERKEKGKPYPHKTTGFVGGWDLVDNKIYTFGCINEENPEKMCRRFRRWFYLKIYKLN